MVHEALRTLLSSMEVVRPAFTRPGFATLSWSSPDGLSPAGRTP